MSEQIFHGGEEADDSSDTSDEGVGDAPQFPFDLETPPGPLEPETRALAERIEEAIEDRTRSVEPHILQPLAVLDEIDALCRSLEHGRPVSGIDDRRSLASDLQLTFTTLGDAARAALQPAHYEVANDLVPHLPQLLEDPGGRLHVSGLVSELRRRLISEEGIVALWRDVLAAARSGRSERELAVAGSRLIEVIEACGFEWRWVSLNLVQYLRRGLFDEVEGELRRPLERSAKVAWFVFGYADLPDGYLRVGQVQFFSSRLWPDSVRDREFINRLPDAEYPEEITDDVVEQTLAIKPEFAPPKLVYARVELQGPRASGNRNPWAHGLPPLIWAREHVQSLVQAATFKQGGSTWRLLEGGAVYTDRGGWSGSWPIHDPERFNPQRDARDPLHEGTGDALENLPSGFAERLAEGALDAKGAAREVKWHLGVARQDDPAQRIALYVRGFELALPIIGEERWHSAVKRYFRDFWALNRVGDEVVRLAHDTEMAFIYAGQDEVIKDIPRFIEHHGRRFVVTLEAFVESASTLLERFPPTPRSVKRRLKGVARWADDHQLALNVIDAKRQQFDTLLNRATRQRNAVVHGIETVPAVIGTVEPFVASLAGTVVATAVEEAGSGSSIQDALERGRIIEGRRLWRLLHDDAPVASILFGQG
ncbi:MAG: hypothetical protein WBQ14_06355 [Gaiellaceae bacterium]